MSATQVDQYLYLLDAAFDGRDWHSVLRNLGSVKPEEWGWVPPGGRRSIQEIVAHLASCKLMYENYAFGDASLSWDDPFVKGDDIHSDPSATLAWLRDAHARLRGSIAALDDAELLRLRRTNWGEEKETRWIIATMIQHDLYHAGEINHIRALCQGNDG